MAELPQASNINGCDTKTGLNSPAKTAGNPAKCRTFVAGGRRFGKTTAEVVDTFKAMLDRARLALVRPLHKAMLSQPVLAFGPAEICASPSQVRRMQCVGTLANDGHKVPPPRADKP